jgi:hypothetical protein
MKHMSCALLHSMEEFEKKPPFFFFVAEMKKRKSRESKECKYFVMEIDNKFREVGIRKKKEQEF